MPNRVITLLLGTLISTVAKASGFNTTDSSAAVINNTTNPLNTNPNATAYGFALSEASVPPLATEPVKTKIRYDKNEDILGEDIGDGKIRHRYIIMLKPDASIKLHGRALQTAAKPKLRGASGAEIGRNAVEITRFAGADEIRAMRKQPGRQLSAQKIAEQEERISKLEAEHLLDPFTMITVDLTPTEYEQLAKAKDASGIQHIEHDHLLRAAKINSARMLTSVLGSPVEYTDQYGRRVLLTPYSSTDPRFVNLDLLDGKINYQLVTRYTGAGVWITDLDTGYNPTVPAAANVVEAVSYADDNSAANVDEHLHGSFTLYEMSALATDASYVVRKFLNNQGQGTVTALINALNGARFDSNVPAGILNMSIGGPDSPSADTMFRIMIGLGNYLSIANGNGYGALACDNIGGSLLSSAATSPYVFMSEDLDQNLAVDASSNIGSCTTFSGIGQNNYALVSQGVSITMTGTSMIAPQVSALLAFWLEAGYGGADLKQTVIANAFQFTPAVNTFSEANPKKQMAVVPDAADSDWGYEMTVTKAYSNPTGTNPQFYNWSPIADIRQGIPDGEFLELEFSSMLYENARTSLELAVSNYMQPNGLIPRLGTEVQADLFTQTISIPNVISHSRSNFKLHIGYKDAATILSVLAANGNSILYTKTFPNKTPQDILQFISLSTGAGGDTVHTFIGSTRGQIGSQVGSTTNPTLAAQLSTAQPTPMPAQPSPMPAQRPTAGNSPAGTGGKLAPIQTADGLAQQISIPSSQLVPGQSTALKNIVSQLTNLQFARFNEGTQPVINTSVAKFLSAKNRYGKYASLVANIQSNFNVFENIGLQQQSVIVVYQFILDLIALKNLAITSKDQYSKGFKALIANLYGSDQSQTLAELLVYYAKYSNTLDALVDADVSTITPDAFKTYILNIVSELYQAGSNLGVAAESENKLTQAQQFVDNFLDNVTQSANTTAGGVVPRGLAQESNAASEEHDLIKIAIIGFLSVLGVTTVLQINRSSKDVLKADNVEASEYLDALTQAAIKERAVSKEKGKSLKDFMRGFLSRHVNDKDQEQFKAPQPPLLWSSKAALHIKPQDSASTSRGPNTGGRR